MKGEDRAATRAAPADDNGYPRILDKQGCIFGQHVAEEVDDVKEKVKGIERKIDRLTWVLATAAVSFGLLALSLWLK